MTCAGVAALLLLATAPLSAQAQADRWDGQVRAAFVRAHRLAATRGFAPTGIELVGTLFTDESEPREVELPAGASYLALAVCDVDCGRLNLVLVDPKGDEIASDRGLGNAPMVEAPTVRGGRYRIRVIMGSCRVSPCRYGVLVYRKE